MINQRHLLLCRYISHVGDFSLKLFGCFTGGDMIHMYKRYIAKIGFFDEKNHYIYL